MTEAPETDYTRSADGTDLAYQVSGDGPLEWKFARDDLTMLMKKLADKPDHPAAA
jgi:hypothetical protein